MADDRLPLEALSVPFGDLIASVGRGVADAQRDMDAASIATLQAIYEDDRGLFQELQRIGYRPNWYHIPEVEGELQIALTVSAQETRNAAPGAPTRAAAVKLYATPIDAGYTSRFGFTLQATSKIKFRIVPVPPSNAAEAMQVMPVIVGLTLAEARARLSLLTIVATFPEDRPDTARVLTQQPPPGTLLGPTTTVSMTVSAT
jgi:hypothetical protein